MLDIDSAVVLFFALANGFAVWWLIVVLRPSIARQHLEIRVQRVHDALLDAWETGELHCSEDHLASFLAYCSGLTRHAANLSIVSAFLLSRVVEREGMSAEQSHRRSKSSMLIAAQQEVDGFVWDYMIRGSKAWLVLEPARVLKKTFESFARSVRRRVGSRPAPRRVLLRPSDLASDWRQAAEGDLGGRARSMTLVVLDEADHDDRSRELALTLI